jgi:hypothetical protein
MASRRRTDATASAIGFYYQAAIALECCFQLEERQTVVLEKAGDVAQIDSHSIEVKHYLEPLTDLHDSFWKTLRNWMDDNFNDTSFRSLILLTTASFGVNSKLVSWNEIGTSKRLNLILALAHAAKVKHDSTPKVSRKSRSRWEKAEPAKIPPAIPSYIVYMRYILKEDRREKLERILSKIIITTKYPNYEKLFKKLCDIYAKGMSHDNKIKFINMLIGFIINPGKASKTWEISYDDFDKEFATSRALFNIEKFTFPQLDFNFKPGNDQAEIAKWEDIDFVKKIKEIRYDCMIPLAIRDFNHAKKTVEVIIAERNIPYKLVENYYHDLRQNFYAAYWYACARKISIDDDSIKFFNQIIDQPPIQMQGCSTPTQDVKNGMIHDLLNSNDDLAWRLTDV